VEEKHMSIKKIVRKTGYTVAALVAIVFIAGLILAFLPTKSKTNHSGISAERAAMLRESYKGPHDQFTTSDGEMLFLWRWNPDTLVEAKKDIAVLIFHGITAYGGAYTMAGVPLSSGGYTTFGLDYRGHGLSGGNRGDAPGLERWITDLAESVKYIKGLGFSKVIVLGHSLGVASAICAVNKVPDDVAGVILLSGAYEGRPGLSTPPTLFEKTKILASSVFRPSYPTVEYYRKGMTVTKDSLFNLRYTLRFLTMLDVKKLRLSENLNIPVLVGAGDKDELFEVDKVKELYDLVPGDKKEFLVMKNAIHAKIPLELIYSPAVS
jgi:acylglycerol lipase